MSGPMGMSFLSSKIFHQHALRNTVLLILELLAYQLFTKFPKLVRLDFVPSIRSNSLAVRISNVAVLQILSVALCSKLSASNSCQAVAVRHEWERKKCTFQCRVKCCHNVCHDATGRSLEVQTLIPAFGITQFPIDSLCVQGEISMIFS